MSAFLNYTQGHIEIGKYRLAGADAADIADIVLAVSEGREEDLTCPVSLDDLKVLEDAATGAQSNALR